MAHHGSVAEQYVVQVVGGLACRNTPLLLQSYSGAIFGDDLYRGDTVFDHCLISVSILACGHLQVISTLFEPAQVQII